MKNLLLLILLTQSIAFAETKKPAPVEGEEVDLTKITEKYWAEGKETELGVVQNRKYTTAKKLEIATVFSQISSDAFLKVYGVGGAVGYHFSPYTSVHFVAWKALVSASDALIKFKEQTHATVDTNYPRAYYGFDVKQNFLYGKASLFGKMIIYVDLFIMGGIGITQTESGGYLTPNLGLGQKIYLNERMSINLDYRVMRYNETILGKNTTNLGKAVGERGNTTDVVSLGLSFFLF